MQPNNQQLAMATPMHPVPPATLLARLTSPSPPPHCSPGGQLLLPGLPLLLANHRLHPTLRHRPCAGAGEPPGWAGGWARLGGLPQLPGRHHPRPAEACTPPLCLWLPFRWAPSCWATLRTSSGTTLAWQSPPSSPWSSCPSRTAVRAGSGVVRVEASRANCSRPAGLRRCGEECQPPIHGSTHHLPCAVAYGVIAGLAAYIAIHAPFWAWDYFKKRWRGGGGGGESPRHNRRLKRCGQWRAPCSCRLLLCSPCALDLLPAPGHAATASHTVSGVLHF